MNDDSLKLKVPSEPAMLGLAARLAAACPDTAVIFLEGNLGAGKTTLARGFIRSRGYIGTIKSPTYTIVEPYQLEHSTVFHFDFYRLQDPEELEYIGIQDYFTKHAICLIEWPEKGEGLLPPPDLSCYIEPQGTGRDVELVAHSERGKDILKRLQDENKN